jgi:hypothetical protein
MQGPRSPSWHNFLNIIANFSVLVIFNSTYSEIINYRSRIYKNKKKVILSHYTPWRSLGGEEV